jgi:hypothetical protein
MILAGEATQGLMSGSTLQALLTFVLGGGAIALVTQIVKASRLWRSGRLATTREVIRDIAAARDEAEDREAILRQDKDYWRSVAADYSFQLRQAGLLPNPPEPMSPSERQRQEDRLAGRAPSLRAERARRAPSTEEVLEESGGAEDSFPR